MASVKLTPVDNQIDKDDDDRVKHIYTTHEIQGNRYELELMEESNGTIKLCSLIPDIATSHLGSGVVN